MKKESISKLISGLEAEWKTEGEPQRFSVELETGEFVEAELLTVLEIGEEEYAIYSIPGKPGKKDILASRVIQDENGYDTLVDLDDPAVKETIRKFLEETILMGGAPTQQA